MTDKHQPVRSALTFIEALHMPSAFWLGIQNPSQDTVSCGPCLSSEHLHSIHNQPQPSRASLLIAMAMAYRQTQRCGVAVMLMLALTVASVAAQDNFTDFGSEIVGSATDLNAANELYDAEEAKSMESLLHWAICKLRGHPAAFMGAQYLC
jgi:hypothetical protein